MQLSKNSWLNYSQWVNTHSINTQLLTIINMVEVNGIEPMTSWLQTRRSPC